MFVTLLIVNFALALSVSLLVMALFSNAIHRIVGRIIVDPVSRGWANYVRFAIVVAGVSSGVRVWELERYSVPRFPEEAVLELTRDRWILEIYSTIIQTLQGTSNVLLTFFAAALVAYVAVRLIEHRTSKQEGEAATFATDDDANQLAANASGGA